MNDIKVSVVIATHKRCSQLKHAINSALTQSYKCSQIVVVSDGFDSDTDRMMKQMQIENLSVQYILVDPAQGGNHARNVGVNATTNDYIAFLDDDDEWHSKKIERQVKLFKDDNSIGLVCTAYNSVFVDTGKIIRFVPTAEYDNSKKILIRNNIGSTTSVMIKKAVFLNAGMFDEALKAVQDYEMWIRLCQISKVGVVKEPSAQYNNDSTVAQISNNTNKYIDAYQYVINKHNKLFSEKLSNAEYKTRISGMMIAISKKALRNSEHKIAREYATRAFRLGSYAVAVACYMSSYIPYSLILKAKSALDRLIKQSVRR